MDYKVNFLDRVEQTFSLLIKNKRMIIWPISSYLALAIINLLILKAAFSFVHFGSDWYLNPTNLSLLSGYFIFLILYILAFLVVELGFVRNIKDAINGNEKEYRGYLDYGLKNLLNSFRTYYYVFMYVLLIPSVILISGLVILLGESLSGHDIATGSSSLAFLGMGLILISAFLLILMSIYRGTKSRFAIMKAVDNEDFSRSSFVASLGLSDGKWLRIFGNIFFIGVLVGLVSSLFGQIGGTIDLIFTGYPPDYASGIRSGDFSNQSISAFADSLIGIRFSSLISAIVGGAGFVFINTFLFIFYRRLEQEKVGGDSGKGHTIESNTDL